MTLYEELTARGLIAQTTNEEEIRDMINNGKATFYIGFDCTADSLTAGHFMARACSSSMIRSLMSVPPFLLALSISHRHKICVSFRQS